MHALICINCLWSSVKGWSRRGWSPGRMVGSVFRVRSAPFNLLLPGGMIMQDFVKRMKFQYQSVKTLK